MRYSAPLQEFVEALLSRHGVNDSELEMQFRLGERELLVVSRTADGHQIRLNRFTLIHQDMTVQELEILFFVDKTGHWIPYEYFRPATRRQVCGVINRQTQSLVLSNPLFQRGLVSQCDLWTTRLSKEGWLARSTKMEAGREEWDGLMLWRLPTVDEPDDDQIEYWLMDDVCEATDGCVVEPDGICPHGYPSWLRHLGLV